MNYGTAYGGPTTALRFFNVYGPGQSLSNPYTGVAAIFMSRIKNGQAPGIFEDGRQTRDFISVHDIVQGCMLALTKKAANNQVFNVGTGKATSVLELAERLIRIFGSRVKPKAFHTFRKGDIRHCYADNTRICEVLGFRPRVDLDSGMRELIEWAHGIKAVDGFEKAHRELKKRKLV
jgi:dTDP-L-rhamnose 4-epimerase